MIELRLPSHRLYLLFKLKLLFLHFTDLGICAFKLTGGSLLGLLTRGLISLFKGLERLETLCNLSRFSCNNLFSVNDASHSFNTFIFCDVSRTFSLKTAFMSSRLSIRGKISRRWFVSASRSPRIVSALSVSEDSSSSLVLGSMLGASLEIRTHECLG